MIYETPEGRADYQEDFRWRMIGLYRRWIEGVGMPDRVAMVRGIRRVVEEARDGLALTSGEGMVERGRALEEVAPAAWTSAVSAYKAERADVIARAWRAADKSGASAKPETTAALGDLAEKYPVDGPGWWQQVRRRFLTLAGTPIGGAECDYCGRWNRRRGGDRGLLEGEVASCTECATPLRMPALIWAPKDADTATWTWEIRAVWAAAQVVAGDKEDAASRLVRRMTRIYRCGGLWDWSAVLECGGCGDRQTQQYRCNDKFCPMCARVRSVEYAKRVRAMIEKGGVRKAKKIEGATLRMTTEHGEGRRIQKRLEAEVSLPPIDPERLWFLTLTMGEKVLRGLSARDAIRKTLSAWKKLQRRAAFHGVQGGVRKIEIKAKRGWWHVHVHAVLVADWTEWRTVKRVRRKTGQAFDAVEPFEGAEVFRAWEDVGGGSPEGQDCVRLYGADALSGLLEAFKYQTKFDTKTGALPDAKLEELVEALGSMTRKGQKKGGQRVLQGFGCLYNVTVANTCVICGSQEDHGPGQICECGRIHVRPQGVDQVRDVMRDGRPAPKERTSLETEPVAVSELASCPCGKVLPIFPVPACICCGWLRTHRTACRSCGSHSLRFDGLAVWHGHATSGSGWPVRGGPGSPGGDRGGAGEHANGRRSGGGRPGGVRPPGGSPPLGRPFRHVRSGRDDPAGGSPGRGSLT